MGRGLSPLQRWILREVERLGDLYYADICERYFGWTPVRPIERYGQGSWAHVPRGTTGQLVWPSFQYFSPRSAPGSTGGAGSPSAGPVSGWRDGG